MAARPLAPPCASAGSHQLSFTTTSTESADLTLVSGLRGYQADPIPRSGFERDQGAEELLLDRVGIRADMLVRCGGRGRRANIVHGCRPGSAASNTPDVSKCSLKRGVL
jgi:hypothetical protein